MTITAVQLRQRVAEELKLYSPDQELSADVASRIDTSITDTRSFLQEKGLCWWASDTIPNSVVQAHVWIVAARSCAKFGRAGQGYESGDDRGRAELAGLKPSVDRHNVASEEDWF